MTRSNTAIFIFVIAIFTASGVAQSADTVEELKVCAEMTDQEARLACFDNLGERVLQEEPVGQKPAQEEKVQPETETETATVVEPLPDDFGSSETVQYGGLITSCKRGYYGDLYFVFENGQVWKEVSGRSTRLKECNFNATITRDGFGYQMQIDGIDRTFRVKRNR
jgi:hypothetical protein